MFRILSVCCPATLLLAANTTAHSAEDSGSHFARYLITGAKEHDTCVAATVELDVRSLPEESSRVWEMNVTLRDGRILAVRATSERAPMTSPYGPGRFTRYAFRPPEGGGCEYVDEQTGEAVLPRFDFVSQFLPTPAEGAVYVDGFAASGGFLGHMATLESVGTREFPPEWEDQTVLRLRTDLWIGTSRTVRDDGTGQDENREYSYVQFTEKDYDEMIEAGVNYFGVTAEQLPYVRDRAVYWRHSPTFPDDFYRSNYVGVRMFTDEPMIRMGWQGVVAEELRHPHQVVSYLVTRVAAMYADNGAEYGVEEAVKKQGISLGTLRLLQQDVPTWETIYESAFYELMGGAPGIVHEGRYVMPEGYGWHPSAILGTGLETSAEEMLRCYFAFLRGAARAWAGQWGMAIYGQSDPEIRLEALTLAYDMGAKYCWFWTSDHDHHVPYTEQLRLTQALADHARKNPRPPLEEIRDVPRTAIAFPMGYSVSWGSLWGKTAFENERLTRKGAFYREVAATALWEGILRAKQGIDFDFTVDHDGLNDLGYERIVRVGEDASVDVWPPPMATKSVQLSLSANLGDARPISVPADATQTVRAACLSGRSPEIDGWLDDWPEVELMVLDGPPESAVGWEGAGDLSGKIMFGYDREWLYIGAVVKDDVQSQEHRGWSLWKGDSLQVALDPLNARTAGNYGPNMHEIGFALVDGRPVCWRWVGRRGQPREEVEAAILAIKRNDEEGITTYEAAIPLAELQPLLPEVFGTAGVAVVLNDADTAGRESFLESNPGALTYGKHPESFSTLVFEPPSDLQKEGGSPVREWAGIVWHDTVAPEGGSIEADVYAQFRDEGTGRIELQISPAGSTLGTCCNSFVTFPGGATPSVRTLTLTPNVPPGEYRLSLTLKNEKHRVLAQDTAPLYVYPQ